MGIRLYRPDKERCVSRQLSVPGVSIYIVDSGPYSESSAYLFVHGWLGDHSTWNDLLAHFPERGRTIAVDLRGHGMSSAPPSGYSTVTLATDIGEVADQLELERIILVGHSMGCSVSTRVAIARPDLVKALILVDPDYGGDPSHEPRLRAIMAQPDKSSIKSSVARLFENRIDANTSREDLRRRHLKGVWDSSADVVAATLRANLNDHVSIRFRPRADRVIPQRTQPTLSFHRDDARANWEKSVARNPRSLIKVVPNCGHWIHEEQPEHLALTMSSWLRDVDLVDRFGRL